MKLYFVTDQEGVAGVLDWHYAEGKFTDSGNRLLLDEVRAALDGARKFGQLEATVLQGHHTSCLDELEAPDVRVVRVNEGTWPFQLDSSFDGLLFIGQHSMAETPKGHLCHTMNGAIREIRLNGRVIGEIGLWVYLAASVGVPTIFLSGDHAACEEAKLLVPGITAASVKQGLSIHRADHLAPAVACEKIRSGVVQAMECLCLGTIAVPECTAEWTLEIEMVPQRTVVETYEIQDQQGEGVEKINRSTIRMHGAALPELLKRRRNIRIWKTVGPVEERC